MDWLYSWLWWLLLLIHSLDWRSIATKGVEWLLYSGAGIYLYRRVSAFVGCVLSIETTLKNIEGRFDVGDTRFGEHEVLHTGHRNRLDEHDKRLGEHDEELKHHHLRIVRLEEPRPDGAA